jgi:hypothetical protein
VCLIRLFLHLASNNKHQTFTNEIAHNLHTLSKNTHCTGPASKQRIQPVSSIFAAAIMPFILNRPCYTRRRSNSSQSSSSSCSRRSSISSTSPTVSASYGQSAILIDCGLPIWNTNNNHYQYSEPPFVISSEASLLSVSPKVSRSVRRLSDMDCDNIVMTSRRRSNSAPTATCAEQDSWGQFVDVAEAEEEIIRASKILSKRYSCYFK